MMRELLQTRSAVLADVEVGPGPQQRLLVRSDLTGTVQIYELTSAPELIPITALPEPVATALYIPGQRRAVIEVDSGGDERHQLYLVDLDRTGGDVVTDIQRLEAVTGDPRFVHNLAGISPDGRFLAYVSNRGNGVDFDVWLCDLADGAHRCLYAEGGWCAPGSGLSPDGRWLSIMRPGPRPLDLDLLLIDVITGEVRVVLPHPDEAAFVGAPAWAGPDAFYVSSNVRSEFARVIRYELSTGAATPVVPWAPWDTGAVTSRDGAAICIIENRNGASYLRTGAPSGAGPQTDVPMAEPGIVVGHGFGPPIFSRDGSRLYYTLSTPRTAGDIWAYDLGTGAAVRVTDSPAPAAATELVHPEVTEVASFDGERVPLFVFRPRSAGSSPPVVVFIHGGPESQAVLKFDPVVQGLVGAGYAVVVPNVRGSTGYGKRYAALDDTTKRLDSVRDLAAVHGFLARAGLDDKRAALFGGSYGGYMVLAGLAFQPELWAAGVDLVGVSDLVTFLENTSAYRRAHREREYGSLEHDREFLASASPLRHAASIRAPLFVVHGRNDPRVPVSEAQQLVETVSQHGVRCELVIYEDEGHGLARLSNRLDAYPRAVAFLDDVLRNGEVLPNGNAR
jgi:dipeptidyl aminopeptidase/acylaminoacyl peptidase